MGRRQGGHQPGEVSATVEELLGALEAACMRALWQASPGTVGQVRAEVNASQDSQLAYTTVMTVLARLHEKGFLERDRRGRGYRYWPAYSERELLEALARRKVDELVDSYGQVALAQFAGALRRIDPELLKQVTELASQRGGEDDSAR